MSDTTETETETGTNTNTDEPSKAELHERVEQLESTVAKMMPSRRDALRMGAAGLAGAAGLRATTQPAAASTGSAGQIGDPSNRPDLFADTVDANTVTGARQGCRVFLNSVQNIAAGNRAKIQFDSKAYDSDNNYDTGTGNFTCPEDGLYMANLQVQFEGGSSGDRRTAVIGNGGSGRSNSEGSIMQLRSSDRFVRLSTSTINKYSKGNSIAAYAQNSSSNDTVGNGQDNFASFFEVAFLGGL